MTDSFSISARLMSGALSLIVTFLLTSCIHHHQSDVTSSYPFRDQVIGTFRTHQTYYLIPTSPEFSMVYPQPILSHVYIPKTGNHSLSLTNKTMTKIGGEVLLPGAITLRPGTYVNFFYVEKRARDQGSGNRLVLMGYLKHPQTNQNIMVRAWSSPWDRPRPGEPNETTPTFQHILSGMTKVH